MPHAARLLIESVYGEDVVMPEGFARSEQEQVGKYYCDRAMAKKFVLNFRPGYAANINDYLPENCRHVWLRSLFPCGCLPVLPVW